MVTSTDLPTKKSRSPLATYAVIAASIIVVLAGMHAARTILAPVFMATFLAVLLLPPFNWLRSKGLSRITSLVLIILAVLIIGSTTTTIITVQLKQFADDLPTYHKRLNETLLNYNLDFGQIFPFFREESNPMVDPSEAEATTPAVSKLTEATRPSGPSSSAPSASAASPSAASSLATGALALAGGTGDARRETTPPADAKEPSDTEPRHSNAETSEETPDADSEISALHEPWGVSSEQAVRSNSYEFFSFLGNFVGEMTSFARSAFIIILLVVFMLVEAARLPLKVAAAFGNRTFAGDRVKRVIDDIRRYMVIKTFISVIVGFLVTVLLIVMKVRYPVLWGIIAFFLNYIPNIGSVISAMPPILLATVDMGLVTGLVTGVFLASIHCGMGYILEPKLLGEGLDLSPLVVLMSLIFCGWLLGPVGMFLSPPLAVVGKIILQSFPETRWIAVLMANSVPKEEI